MRFQTDASGCTSRQRTPLGADPPLTNRGSIKARLSRLPDGSRNGENITSCVRVELVTILPSVKRVSSIAMRLLLAAVVALSAGCPAFAEVYAPPNAGLTTVTVDFFLLNLNAVDERDETFDADLYLEYQWDDPRLAHDGPEEQLFADGAVDERLSSMWWPQIEYVNTAEPTITNQSLEILPSGHVKYTVGLTSRF
jgi:hypothetical protein